jgi:hypothetical protein
LAAGSDACNQTRLIGIIDIVIVVVIIITIFIELCALLMLGMLLQHWSQQPKPS